MRDRDLLWHINAIRQCYGVEPINRLPQAHRNVAQDCVIARALRDIDDQVMVYNNQILTTDEVFAQIIAVEFGTKMVHADGRPAARLPQRVRNWITEFDRGVKPHLIDSTDEESVYLIDEAV